MDAGLLVREARRRAGLTQRQLAARAGTTQPTIARVETGATEPSFVQVRRLIRACGLDLRVALVEIDDSDWSVTRLNLPLDPEARVRQHQAAIRFARAGRQALADVRA
ncbi:MAG: helix-turn-helix domain-containing protein [Actinomycetota bacterium]